MHSLIRGVLFFAKKLAKIRHLVYAVCMNMNKLYFLLAKHKKLEFEISDLITLRAEIKDDDIAITIEKTSKDFQNGTLQDKKRISTIEKPTLEELQNIFSVPKIQDKINTAYSTELAIFEEKTRALNDINKIIDNLPGARASKKKVLKNIFELASKNNQFRLSSHFVLCIVDVCNKAPSRAGDLHFQLQQYMPSKKKAVFLDCDELQVVQQVGTIFEKDKNAIFVDVINENSKVDQRSSQDLILYEHLKRNRDFQNQK